MAATFSMRLDDRTDEEREKDRKKYEANEKYDAPMDTKLQEDLGPVHPEIQINRKVLQDMQGGKNNPDQHERFTMERLFDAVSSGDVTRLEGLEQYLKDNNTKFTKCEYMPGGKTVLMKALLNLKDGDKTVEHLLGIAEKNDELHALVNAKYEDPKNKGQTALHIAIERRNKHYAELLIQKGADVHAKADGTFFQPLGEECFYFGELPLSLAACTNQEDMVDLLMDKADVRCTDTLGNTVLHALVMVADNSPENTAFVISMYDYILTKDAVKNPEQVKLEDIENNQGLTSILANPKKVMLEDIKNKQGLTSVKLAAKLGKIELLKHILHREFQKDECRSLSRKFAEWRYGPVFGSLYDLHSVDTYESNSVLEIVVYGSDIPNRLKMLQIEPLNKLLEDKWNRFAKRLFFFKLIVYVLYLLIFTAVSYNRDEGQPPFPIREGIFGILFHAGQVIMVIGSLYFFISVLTDLYKKCPSLQTMLEDGYSDLLFLLQAGMFIICVGLYLNGKQEYLAFLVLSVAMCWINLLYFSRGVRNMGIYNIMIQRIFLKDILRFLFVYLVFLIGFSAAVVTLLKEPKKETSSDTDNQNVTESCQKPTFKSISFTTLELFKFTIGMGDLEFTEDYEYKNIFYVLIISYLILTYILLLNMLIAVMNETVSEMSEESTKTWKLQRAITVLDIERYARCLKLTSRSGVKRNLGKQEEDWRWCLRVEEVNWKNWNRNLGIIREDPGGSDTGIQPEPYKEPGQRNVSRQRSKRQTVPEGPETEPLASSSV